ncbi:ATP-binding protein [uncultured Aliiroseovarius sp.]|uniref:ATP-binding protein n=1 Tax=uncultured Aliiroseovarius sp. TaxID=1658783 RepID=UPI00261C5D14|nr:ATP-binding protein [uncultured Aliiroseovarius sp.]
MFANFDPLNVTDTALPDESVVLKRTKRSIHSILHSYVGWYDPFAELIQNALDAVDKRAQKEEFSKKINIIINEKENQITVSDNGVGLDESAFYKFLAPHESFKEKGERGSKGVGATFLAYGFNYIRIDTKTKHFSAHGEMEDGRNWLHNDNASSNPEVFPTTEPLIDAEFDGFSSGVSITIRFDETTKPSKLSWPGLKSAEIWYMALSVKTALGAVAQQSKVNISIRHISKSGDETVIAKEKTGYLPPHTHVKKVVDFDTAIKLIDENVKRKGAAAKLPAKVRNLDAVSICWSSKEILEKIDGLDDEDKAFCIKHDVNIIASFMSGAKIWRRFAEKQFGYRSTAKIYEPGLQLAADNMPQGDMLQIPLVRYTGRQNQVHIAMHFKDCVVDLGRKGFDKSFVDFAKKLSRLLLEKNFTRIRDCLRNEDNKSKNLIKSDKVDGWKKQLEQHETNAPLLLRNENFFVPVNEISISAEPSREQDVIALFNQLIAGGVVRGIKVVGTNEMSTYDGAYRVKVGPDFENHVYDEKANPLGVTDDISADFEEDHPDGFLSNKLKVLEYKYSLDGLVSDLTTGDKQAADIDLVIAWEAGEDYIQLFGLTSLLIDEGSSDREYHGITHTLSDEHGNHVMDVILLRDLIAFLNDPETEAVRQAEYES